jgi:TfoX/Sxy family transcriptional regulator of competence genes
MAYSEQLAQRIRDALAGNRAITEKKMFGGIAFLRHGLMFVGVSDSALMARVGKPNHADSLGAPDGLHWQTHAGLCLH